MKKLLFRIAVVAVAFAGMTTVMSCGGKKDNDKEEETAVEKTVESKYEPKTLSVEIFSAMPVKGDKASYFSFSGPDDANTITLTGGPSDNEYSSFGVIKATVDLNVLKSFSDKIHSWDNYSGLELNILDENHEEIATLSMNSTDKDLLEAELAKPKPGTISLIFKKEVYGKDYEKIFNKAKYVQIEGADWEGEKEYAREQAKVEKESAVSSSSSDSKSSSSRDDDDDDDDDGKESRWKRMKEKTKEKTKELKEKATEKIDQWLDR